MAGQIDSEARAEAKRRGLDMRRVYEFLDGVLNEVVIFTCKCTGCWCQRHDMTCSCPNSGCRECGYTGKRRLREPVPADAWGPHGPGTRSQRRYGEFLQLRDAHTEMTFREYLQHFAGKDGRA